jgi:hypothetical protein
MTYGASVSLLPFGCRSLLVIYRCPLARLKPGEASLGGLIFFAALYIIGIMLMHTDETLRAGLQSEYKVERQRNPLL